MFDEETKVKLALLFIILFVGLCMVGGFFLNRAYVNNNLEKGIHISDGITGEYIATTPIP